MCSRRIPIRLASWESPRMFPSAKSGGRPTRVNLKTPPSTILELAHRSHSPDRQARWRFAHESTRYQRGGRSTARAIGNNVQSARHSTAEPNNATPTNSHFLIRCLPSFAVILGAIAPGFLQRMKRGSEWILGGIVLFEVISRNALACGSV